MSENQAPASSTQTPAPVAASQTEPKATITEAPKGEAKSNISSTETSSATSSTEAQAPAKVEAAAEKTGAEQVAKDKWELKVDGETLTLNESEMVKWAQLGKAGQKRMQEAIEFQKQTKTNWEKLQQALKENPESVLEDENIGHNKIELAKKWLAEKMEQDQKSPEQLELEALRKETANYKKQQEEAIKKAKEEADARETEHNMKALENEMLGAFKKYQLPNSSAVVDRMTGIMEVAEKNNIQVSVDDVAKIVRDEIKKDFQELAALLPDEDFDAFMGEGVTKRVKDSTLKRAKSSPKVDVTDVTKAPKTAEAPKAKISIKDFMKPDWAK